MIRVTLPSAPAHYRTSVRIPGEAFLKHNPSPSNKDWSNHAYWRKIHHDLYKGHRGICVYCSSWTPRAKHSPRGLDHTSVDHFVPKSLAPKKAYEWSNFRLCRTRLNHKKDNYLDVLDPCTVTDGWFIIDFTTFQIRPAPGLPQAVESSVISTIDRLQLNVDNDYVDERIAVIREYALDRLSLPQLQSKYPFIAQQIQTQNFDMQFKVRFRAFFRNAQS